MDVVKQALHALVIAISRRVSSLLPDRVPVTFVGAEAARELCRAIAQAGIARVLVLAEATFNYPVPRYMSQTEAEGLIRRMRASQGQPGAPVRR